MVDATKRISKTKTKGKGGGKRRTGMMGEERRNGKKSRSNILAASTTACSVVISVNLSFSISV